MDQSAGAQTQYALTRNLLDRKGTLPISEAEYRELRGARDSLLMLLSFEEKFEAVTQNFLEFESELLNSTMQYVMNRAPGYQWFFAKRALLNRKLSNLLSAARSYSSYGRGYVAPLFGQGSPEEGTCLERFEKLYQANSFIEALRNHAQHHGIPTHVLSFLYGEPYKAFRVGVGMVTKASYLRKEKFNQDELKRLEAKGGKADVVPLTREFVTQNAEVHEAIRSELADATARSEDLILAAIQKFTSNFPDEPTLGLVAARIEGSNICDEVELFADLIECRRWMANKNGNVKRLAEQRLQAGTPDS